MRSKSNSKGIKYCTRCVLPSTFPGLTFNEQGVCSYCLAYHGLDRRVDLKEKYQAKFVALVEECRGRGSYDVLMSYSGGKDSTFTLDLFKNIFGLKVLAFTFDNGFIAKAALENISRITESLDIDHILIKPRFNLLKEIFVAAAGENFYTRKTIERASSICTSCISFVKFIALRLAIEHRIPFLGFGWSPGQAPIQSSVMKLNPAFIQKTQKALLVPLSRIVEGRELRPYFLEGKHFERQARFPWNIHPLSFLEYSEEKIFSRIEALGWKQPDGTGFNSTNCLLNSFAIEVHKKRYHFNPYAWEIAGIVRSGSMSREKGLYKITAPEHPATIEYARQRLGLSKTAIQNEKE